MEMNSEKDWRIGRGIFLNLLFWGKIIYFRLITGRYFFLLYDLITNIIHKECSSDSSIYISSEHFHLPTTCFTSLQNGFVARRLREVNQVYLLLDRVTISILIS